jgi:hypothetical protein
MSSASIHIRNRYYRTTIQICFVLAAIFFTVFCPKPLRAQSLGWEGETGVFITPLAYTPVSEGHNFEPVVGYHYLNAGPVIGDFHQISVTVGVTKRFEFGYTREFHVEGDNATLSPLWNNGFNIFHGKALLIRENSFKQAWLPAISAGFMARSQVHNVGGAVLGKDTSNADVYVVATKLITQTKPIPILLNFGVRGTNAEVWGMAGNAPDFTARVFGAIALAFKGPARSSIILGSEAAQQPHHPDQFPTLNIPTTLTYAARFVPSPNHKLNFDFGIAQIAGQVMPGVNLKARHQAAVQVSYGF